METRDRILEVTATLIERDGSAAATTRAICAAAHLTAPTLYHHFADKDALILVVAAAKLGGRFQSIPLSMSSDPVDHLRGWWDAFVSVAAEHPRLFLAATHVAASTIALPDAFATLQASVKALGAAGLLRVEAALAEQCLWSAAFGIALTACATAPPIHPQLSATVREPLIDALIIRVARPAKPARRPFSRR